MKLDLSIFLIQSKSFQVYFVLDIFIDLLAGDGTIGFLVDFQSQCNSLNGPRVSAASATRN